MGFLQPIYPILKIHCLLKSGQGRTVTERAFSYHLLALERVKLSAKGSGAAIPGKAGP